MLGLLDQLEIKGAVRGARPRGTPVCFSKASAVWSASSTNTTHHYNQRRPCAAYAWIQILPLRFMPPDCAVIGALGREVVTRGQQGTWVKAGLGKAARDEF